MVPETTETKSYDFRVEGILFICEFSKKWDKEEMNAYLAVAQETFSKADRTLYEVVIVREMPGNLSVLGLIWEFRDEVMSLSKNPYFGKTIFIIAEKMSQIVAENVMKVLGADNQFQLAFVDSIEEAQQKAQELNKKED